MRTKKIIATAIVLPLLWITSFTSADYDCSTIDREEMREIMEKQRNSETLTSAEETLLESTKDCMPNMGQNKWQMSDMTDEEKEELQEILEKKKNWEDLTDDEQEILDDFEANRQDKKWERKDLTDEEKEEIKAIVEKKKNWETLTDEEKDKIKNIAWNKDNVNKTKVATAKKVYKRLTTSYKTKINNATKSVMKKINSYSDTKKITVLEWLITKIESKITKVEASSLFDTKKELYSEVYNYLLEDIEAEIEKIETTDGIDDLDLDELFN